MTPVRLVQVGLGAWGRNWAGRILPAVGRIAPVARVDPAPEALAAASAGVGEGAHFASLGEAVAATGPEAVLITAALAAHEALTDEALGLGLHVLVEKPFAPTPATAGRLAERATSSGLVLHVSQNYRFFPAPRAARGLIREGALGPVTSVDIAFHQPALGRDSRHCALPDPLLGDMAIHHFDLLRHILGCEAKSITCRSWNPPGSPFAHAPAAACLITMEDGRSAEGPVVTYRGSWISDAPPSAWSGRWRIQCAGGLLSMESRFPGHDQAHDRLALRHRGGKEERLTLAPLAHAGRAGALDAFARAVRGEPVPEAAATARDNTGSIRLMAAAIASARTGEAVSPAEM